MNDLPKPLKGAVFYEDSKVYCCLANSHITKGQVIVVWKKKVKDLHYLKMMDYEHLMDVVDEVRDVMLKVLKVKKVYLLYMDEVNHVHWHLVPVYNKKGLLVFDNKPRKLDDLSLVEKLRKRMCTF